MTPRRSFLAALAALVVTPVKALRLKPAPSIEITPIFPAAGGWVQGSHINGAWRFERCRDGAIWNGHAWERRLNTGRHLRSAARWRRERSR